MQALLQNYINIFVQNSFSFFIVYLLLFPSFVFFPHYSLQDCERNQVKSSDKQYKGTDLRSEKSYKNIISYYEHNLQSTVRQTVLSSLES